jgi:hypothetical protein
MQKDPRAVWRGALNNPIRKALIDMSGDKPWANVQSMNHENRMHMAEFCAYQFPVHTEGNTWSGRLRYLQNCNSVSVIHDLSFKAHYYHLLEAEGEDQVSRLSSFECFSLVVYRLTLWRITSTSNQISQISKRKYTTTSEIPPSLNVLSTPPLRPFEIVISPPPPKHVTGEG